MCQSSRTSVRARTGAGTATRIFVLSPVTPMSRPSESAGDAHEPHGVAAVVAPANTFGCPADPPHDPRSMTTMTMKMTTRTPVLTTGSHARFPIVGPTWPLLLFGHPRHGPARGGQERM